MDSYYSKVQKYGGLLNCCIIYSSFMKLWGKGGEKNTSNCEFGPYLKCKKCSYLTVGKVFILSRKPCTCHKPFQSGSVLTSLWNRIWSICRRHSDYTTLLLMACLAFLSLFFFSHPITSDILLFFSDFSSHPSTPVRFHWLFLILMKWFPKVFYCLPLPSTGQPSISSTLPFWVTSSILMDSVLIYMPKVFSYIFIFAPSFLNKKLISPAQLATGSLLGYSTNVSPSRFNLSYKN